MAHYDLIIKNGTIVDGTRTPRFQSDLAIKDGKVAKIGGLKTASADKVLDASGLIVAPGFVDLHTHFDAQYFWDPYCTMSGWHGVTSVAIGNCGFGFAPSRVEDRERAMQSMTRNEAIPLACMQEGLAPKWDWTTFPEFMDSLDRTPKGVNCLTYVPLTPLYTWVMGWDEAKKRRPTKEEMDKMVALVNEGMDKGACGWSAQVLGPNSVQRDFDGTPMVTDLMTQEEILTFAQILADRDEGFIELAYQETGEEGNPMESETMKFFEKVAEVAKRPVLYQTVTTDDSNPEQHRGRLRWLEECAKKGLRMHGQGQTFDAIMELTFEDWNLFDATQGWRNVTVGSHEERIAAMQNPEFRQILKDEFDQDVLPRGILPGSYPNLVVGEVSDLKFEKYTGLTVGQIADMDNKHVVDAILDLAVGDDLQTEFIAYRGRTNPELIMEVVDSPYCVAGTSDGGAHVKFSTAGSFPTNMLTWLVRDEQLLSLEDAHYKLSYLPAFMGGFQDRGYIREGVAADIVVYDLENLKATEPEVLHDLPGGEWRRVQKAEGYRWTIVNGEITFEDGVTTGATPGKLLRHGRG
jgi:N-acyl-D-aspartate/D-glutamate deacylase